MKYKTILLDIDGTILDFNRAEDYAIKKVFEEVNIDQTEENISLYLKINHKWWNNFEQGKCDKKILLKSRFNELFSLFNINEDGDVWNTKYLTYLSDQVFYVDYSITFMKKICKDFDVYLCTNGVEKTQMRRLKQTPFLDIVKGVFVSEQVGFQKPQKEYFEYVYNQTKLEKSSTIMIGDSETSDINGGINFGIDTCLISLYKKDVSTKANYTVYSLKELEKLLYK